MVKFLQRITSPRHPIWSVTRLVIYMSALSVILWLNAKNFDVTELRSIVVMFLAGGSAEGIGQLFNMTRKADKQKLEPEITHPIWNMIRLGIYMGTLCCILWLNASHFDETEYRTITWMFVVGAGAEGIGQIFSRLQLTMRSRT